MQPRVTIQALATVWLAVVGLAGAAVTHRLSHDQYFPASPHRHSKVQRNQIGDWRDHDPVEDQPLDLWIGSRRSISAEEPPALPSSSTKFTEQDFPPEISSRNNASSKRDYPFSAWQRWLLNIAGTEFAADKVGYEMPQTLSREAVILPSDLLDDPFVADDTFQDQGPGSVEIYKLDLSRENVLLAATTPTGDLLAKNKSKSPKKTSNLSPKTKATEVKSTTRTHHGQSNVFEEQRTETPPANTNFGVGGVPELQVGCEGLEASSLSSSSSYKAKRSIDTPDREKRQVPASILQDVTPVSLDLDYNLTYDDDEEDEEMDELLKLKRLETTTKSNKPNRGDMDASHLNSDHLNESGRADKLPVRGDLGESPALVDSDGPKIARNGSLEKPPDAKIKDQAEGAKRTLSVSSDGDDGGASKNRGRRLLWLAEANTGGFAYDESERRRAKRSIDWGFGEDEGVVSSNELQTMNARRRKHDMRYHRNAPRKRDQYHEVDSDIDKIRREHEERLAQKRREEEERGLRQQQQGGRRTPNRWTEEEERRRDEMRARQYEGYRRQMSHIPSRTGDDALQRQMEERQRQEAARDRTQEVARRNEEERRRREEEERRRLQEEEETRRRSQSGWREENSRRTNPRAPYDEERRQRPDDDEMKRREEEARRQEWYRKQLEARRRKDEEERRRQEDDRRREEEKRRELAERRRQEEEERRGQQPPSNLMDAKSRSRRPNDIERRDPDEERRAWEQEERRREQKLREYIARNQPINVNHPNRRSGEERRRYRPEGDRDSRMNTNAEEYRRRMEEQRRRQEEEQRKRQEEEQRRRQEEEQRRRQNEEQEEEQRRRQEEEKKLQDYIRRSQPINVPSWNNQSTATGRDLFEERRLIEQARRRDRYPDPGTKRHRGPSMSTYIDPREEVWRRQQETARRREEERRRAREQGEEERRLREEQMRKEAARREQEARREQSRRYEEQRKRLEAVRLREERRRQEALRERSRSQAERTRQPEATRPTSYQDPRLMEHRRRQDSKPIPSNLVRTEEERRKERERQRLEAERRRQQENSVHRWKEHRREESEQERSRQELARLTSLPVSARIIVRPINFTPGSPTVESRGGLGNEVDFTGINPHREGVKVAKFPVAPTPRPPVPSPRPCVWAVVHCCSSNNSRLSKCFESLGCPGINWDPNPCSNSIVEAARTEVMKFYESQ